MTRFQIPQPKNVTCIREPILSPDGRRLVFIAQNADGRRTLWICRLDSLELQPLPGTDGGLGPAFWSPDSRYVGFAKDGKLRKVDVAGGAPQVVCDLQYSNLWSGGAWSSRGTIVFVIDGRELLRVPESGGTPIPLTEFRAIGKLFFQEFERQFLGAIHRPAFLPDGEHFLYGESNPRDMENFIGLGSLEAKPGQRTMNLLMQADLNSGPVYAPGPEPGMGHVLFKRKGMLMAQPFGAEKNVQAPDLASLALAGEAVPIAEGFGPYAGYTASTTGILAYVNGPGAGDAVTGLTWFDRQGNALGNAGEPGMYNSFALSPDGTRVAFSREDLHIWVLDFASGNTTPLSSNARAPVWSPDGSYIAFSKWLSPRWSLYGKASGGVGDEDVLLRPREGDPGKEVQDWLPDGRFLLYSGLPMSNLDLWALPLKGDREPMPYLKSEFKGGHARFSPDGCFVAYHSDESGKNEVYVQPFPIASGGKWMLSEGGGVQPRWRADGKELFYISADSRMMAVEVSTAHEFAHGVPKALFAAPIWGGGRQNLTRYDVTPDGKRFLINTPGPAPPITVVLNREAALKK